MCYYWPGVDGAISSFAGSHSQELLRDRVGRWLEVGEELQRGGVTSLICFVLCLEPIPSTLRERPVKMAASVPTQVRMTLGSNSRT
jgi:hypothetical protein